MFPILRHHWMLWGAWIIGSSILLFANPWIRFGWPELAASVGSLALAIDRRTRREVLLAIGLPSIALLAVADENSPSIARLVLDWFAFIGGVMLGARAVDDQIELEGIAAHLSLGPDPARALAGLQKAIEREIARVRRHGRSFVVLSIAPTARVSDPPSIAMNVPGTADISGTSDRSGKGRVMDRMARARWLLELREVLEEENHLYANIAATEDRVLCLVPEVDESAIEALAKRLKAASLERLGLDIDCGVACFPRDALGVSDLIVAADATRGARTLASVPIAGEGALEASRFDEDEGKRGSGALLRDAER